MRLVPGFSREEIECSGAVRMEESHLVAMRKFQKPARRHGKLTNPISQPNEDLEWVRRYTKGLDRRAARARLA